MRRRSGRTEESDLSIFAASPTPHLRPRTASHAVSDAVIRIRSGSFFASHRAKKRAGWHRGSNFPLSFPFLSFSPLSIEEGSMDRRVGKNGRKNSCLPPGATDPTPPRTMLPSSEFRNHPGASPFLANRFANPTARCRYTDLASLPVPPFLSTREYTERRNQ